MAKNIKFLYKKHISDTAPDMEKLWDRIEGQLENKTDKDQTRIKVSRRNYRKFAAAAASLVLIASSEVTNPPRLSTSRA